MAIEGASHEFATLPSVKEDVLDIILNLKALRVKLVGSEPVEVRLDVRGPANVTAKDFAKNPAVEFVDPTSPIATVEKGGHLKLTATVERGRGFMPTEQRERGKETIGTIQLDTTFSPVKKVSFQVENTRVGRMTNFDKVTMEIATDGSVDPADTLDQAAKILVDHFGRIAQFARGDAISLEEAIVPAASREEAREVKVKKKATKQVKKAKAKPKKAKKATRKTKR